MILAEKIGSHDMYKVECSKFNKLYFVVNILTGIVQSSWSSVYDANRTCKDLNKLRIL